MALDDDGLRYACDSAQARHDGLVKLMDSNDKNALGLMQVFLALATATISAAAALHFGIGSPPTSAPSYLQWVLLAMGMPSAIGAAFCFASMWPAPVNLPGSQADFWQWADRPDVTADEALRLYLQRTAEGHARNEAHNIRAGMMVYMAKLIGVSGPLLALIVLLIGMARA